MFFYKWSYSKLEVEGAVVRVFCVEMITAVTLVESGENLGCPAIAERIITL